MNSDHDRPDPHRPEDELAIESYLIRLRERLAGPGRVKEELVSEVRDGLTVAAQAYHHAGYSDAAAQHQAITDFGPLDAISAEFQNELDIVQGRTTARHASIGLPLLLVLWQLAHCATPWPTLEPNWVHIISALGYAAGLINLIAIAGVWYVRFVAGRHAQPFNHPAKSRKLLGAFVLAALGAYITAMTLIAACTALVSWQLLLVPAIAAAAVISLVLCALLATSARQCLTQPRLH
jgi:hypothetical protein